MERAARKVGLDFVRFIGRAFDDAFRQALAWPDDTEVWVARSDGPMHEEAKIVGPLRSRAELDAATAGGRWFVVGPVTVRDLRATLDG
jgi:hypothetical protein